MGSMSDVIRMAQRIEFLSTMFETPTEKLLYSVKILTTEMCNPWESLDFKKRYYKHLKKLRLRKRERLHEHNSFSSKPLFTQKRVLRCRWCAFYRSKLCSNKV